MKTIFAFLDPGFLSMLEEAFRTSVDLTKEAENLELEDDSFDGVTIDGTAVEVIDVPLLPAPDK